MRAEAARADVLHMEVAGLQKATLLRLGELPITAAGVVNRLAQVWVAWISSEPVVACPYHEEALGHVSRETVAIPDDRAVALHELAHTGLGVPPQPAVLLIDRLADRVLDLGGSEAPFPVVVGPGLGEKMYVRAFVQGPAATVARTKNIDIIVPTHAT